MHPGAVLIPQGRGSVDDQAATSGSSTPARHSDIDQTRPVSRSLLRRRPDSPEGASAVMAQDCALTERQHACHPFPFVAQPRVPDGIDPAMDTMETAAPNPLRDPARRNTGTEELGSRHYAVLPRREAGDCRVGSRLVEFPPHGGSYASAARISPPGRRVSPRRSLGPPGPRRGLFAFVGQSTCPRTAAGGSCRGC